MIRKVTSLFLFLCITISVVAQTDYSNYETQTERLRKVEKEYSSLAKLSSIGKTASGKDIWMLTIGKGKTADKPAIAIVGGVEGNHLLGTELAISFAENIAASRSDSTSALLDKTTFYVFPNMSPDAMEQYFAPLKYERQGNSRLTDDDRDGKVNEDGFEDLDGNGRITMMRVVSPIGDYKVNNEENLSILKADLTKGETGNYQIYTEGTDNDKDGIFNEDGDGGVWFNKNLTYKYQPFVPGSGEFAVSENENRALLDQLYQLFNVYAVVSFSSNNNLSVPYTYNAANASQRIISGYYEADAKVNAIVSDMYNKITSMKDAPKTSAAGGDFLSWAYFHYGRFSFSTPGWFVPKAKTDTSKKEKPSILSDSVATYLKWAASQNITGNYTEWKKIEHPDFPGQIVEVGGVHPFNMNNPSYNLVRSISNSHTAFIQKLAWIQPRIQITNIKTEKLGNNITRITATVMNAGTLPSHTKVGERSYWVKRINVKLNLANGQSLLSGKKSQLLNSLEALSSTQLTWLVKGSGKSEIVAGSPSTGTDTKEINL